MGTTTPRTSEGTVNGTLHCDVLQQDLTQSMGKLPNKSVYIFQQDLAPWHLSKFVQEKVAKLKLNVLEWSMKRLDLNPVEMLWSILAKKLATKPIYLIMELYQRLEEESNGISQLSRLILIDSIPNRIQVFEIKRRPFHVELYRYILIF